MKIKVKRIDKDLPLPIYETNGSVGLDLLSREDTVIKSKEVKSIPCNLIIQIPKGYILFIASRSSTPKKKNLLMPHGFGVIDQDYCGSDDEILAQFYNFSEVDVIVKKGEKVAQALFLPVERIEWDEVSEINDKNRGGFGTTD